MTKPALDAMPDETPQPDTTVTPDQSPEPTLREEGAAVPSPEPREMTDDLDALLVALPPEIAAPCAPCRRSAT